MKFLIRHAPLFSLISEKYPDDLSVWRFEPFKFTRSSLTQTDVFRFSVLDFLMQFPDIMCNCQQNTLCFYIRFPRYRNLRKPVSSFKSPKIPSDWILLFTRSRIASSLVILSRSSFRYWLNFRETYRFFVLFSIKPLKHLCRKMAPAMGSHEALMLSGKGVQTYDQPVND